MPTLQIRKLLFAQNYVTDVLKKMEILSFFCQIKILCKSIHECFVDYSFLCYYSMSSL